MLVAIEGVDRTGKSTLAAELREAWGAEVVHAGPPRSGSLVEYEDPLAQYDPLSGDSLVLDRWHVGEYVWPEIFRRQTDMIDPAVRRHVEMFMCSRACVVVYATRDYDEVRQDLIDHDEPLRPASLALALQRFDEALNHGHNRGFVFEHDHARLHLEPHDISFVAGQADSDVWPLHAITSSWIGHPDPIWGVAVSGMTDGLGIPGRVRDGLHPAVAHLLRGLPETAWRGVALVEVDGMRPETFERFASTADPLYWIAVGDEARELVSENSGAAGVYSPGFSVLRQRSIPDVLSALQGDLSEDQ